MRDNLLIDAAVGPLDDRLERLVARMAGLLKKDGEPGHIKVDGRDYWLHRLPHGVHRLRAEKGVEPAASSSFAWAAPLWDLLLAGAETPEGRSALAHGIKLPCGPCKKNWPEALRGLTEEHLATAEAFRLWVWNERQKIAVSKGREAWPYPGAPLS